MTTAKPMTDTRQHLHQLIERLAVEDLAAAKLFVKRLCHWRRKGEVDPDMRAAAHVQMACLDRPVDESGI
jgi:hypothetical protein